MSRPFLVFIGTDPRDRLAYRAAVASIQATASIDLLVVPLRDLALRRMGLYRRPYAVDESGQMIDGIDHRPFSTQFAFTRFLVPELVRRFAPDNAGEWCLFLDADVLLRRDLAGLVRELAVVDMAEPRAAVAVVKHTHNPPAGDKMGGLSQVSYPRKNWSSVMAFRPDRLPLLTEHRVNTDSGRNLHALTWADDEQIAALSETWNWLEGWSSPAIDPALVHYTRGTPDLIDGPLPYAAEWWEAVDAWRPGMEVDPCDLET